MNRLEKWLDRMQLSESWAMEVARLVEKSHEIAGVLKLLSNQKRLLILCSLEAEGECRVNEMAEAVGLSQSALSQHLAELRAEGLVAFRRDSQSICYSLADQQVERLLLALKDIYCPPPVEAGGSQQ